MLSITGLHKSRTLASGKQAILFVAMEFAVARTHVVDLRVVGLALKTAEIVPFLLAAMVSVS